MSVKLSASNKGAISRRLGNAAYGRPHQGSCGHIDEAEELLETVDKSVVMINHGSLVDLRLITFAGSLSLRLAFYNFPGP